MSPHDDDLTADPVACLHERARQFRCWLEHLRAGDPTFAQASALYPDDMNEWQSAVYLLTGSEPVWNALGRDVLGERSIAPVIGELEHSRRSWSTSERAVMRWATHFWDVYSTDVQFPWVFEEFYFVRWTGACHLHRRIAFSLTPGGGPR